MVASAVQVAKILYASTARCRKKDCPLQGDVVLETPREITTKIKKHKRNRARPGSNKMDHKDNKTKSKQNQIFRNSGQ